jgi:hypothetical protein
MIHLMWTAINLTAQKIVFYNIVNITKMTVTNVDPTFRGCEL